MPVLFTPAEFTIERKHAYDRAAPARRVVSHALRYWPIIIEEGGHDSLLARGGHYTTLYNICFRCQSLTCIEQAREFVQGD